MRKFKRQQKLEAAKLLFLKVICLGATKVKIGYRYQSQSRSALNNSFLEPVAEK